jgi:glucose/arabinose dehydrogenase
MIRGFSRLLFGAILTLLAVAAPACGGSGQEENPFGITSDVVVPAANADAIAFAPDGRLFFVEHWTGAIRVVTADGELLPEPFATLADIAAGLGWGLTGLAIDPEFANNHYVYALYTRLTLPGPPAAGTPTLVRFTEVDNKGTEQTALITALPQTDPAHPFNANGSLHFGADGHLYFTLGDYDNPKAPGPNGNPVPQDLGTPIGKMLRVRKEDGSAPPDNPFVADPTADPRIYALGFRGAFNFTVHPQTGRLYGADSTGVTCEGINILEAGANYAWPNVGDFPFGDCNLGRTKLPIGYLTQERRNPTDFQSAVGVTGMEFVSSEIYPTLGDGLLVCQQSPQELRRLVLPAPNYDQITANDVVARDCWLDVTISPDGFIYYSNLTEIRRLVPPAQTPSSSPAESPSTSPAARAMLERN